MTEDEDIPDDPDWVTAVCEREEIAGLLEAVIREYLAEAGIPPINDRYEESFGDHAIGRYPSRPEMRFFLDDLAAFTPELINRIRKRVLSQFKDWMVVPQFDERELTIAPSGVWFGEDNRKVTRLIKADTPEYQRWLRQARRHDALLYGPLRRQFRYITPLIPAALPIVRQNQVAVLAVFDTFVPPIWKGNPVVWVLTRGGKEPPTFRQGQALREHAVTAEGGIEPEFCEKYWPTTDVPSPFFLLVHELPRKDRRGLTLLAPSPGKKSGKVLGKVAASEPIRDADLKRRKPV